jgi:hypothetical protein
MIGEPDAGKPHVRFDEGVQETCDIAARLRPTLLHQEPTQDFAFGAMLHLVGYQIAKTPMLSWPSP